MISAGCGKSEKTQSFDDAVQIVCSAPSHSDFDKATPENKASMMAKWIEERLTNKEVVAMFESMSSMELAERNQLLSAAAKKANIDNCEFLSL